jgi:hypothetical protein
VITAEGEKIMTSVTEEQATVEAAAPAEEQ